MKKILKAVCILMTISCFMGCHNEAVDKGTGEGVTTIDIGTFSGSSGIRYSEKYRNFTALTEAGVLCYNGGGLLYFVPINEKEKMVCCYDPNCKHPTAEETDGDPQCTAALFDSYTDFAYYEGAVYFFVQTSIDTHDIYKMDTNSAVRERIATDLPFTFGLQYFCIFREDKVYYTANIKHMDETTHKGSIGFRMVEVDLLDGSYRFITEEADNTMNIVNIFGKTVYARTAPAEGGTPSVVTIDINTLEMQTIITQEEWKTGKRYINACDEDSIYYWDKQDYEIGIMNVDGTKEQVLLRGAEGEGYNAVISLDGLYYEREFDYGDEPVGSYFMDLTTGEVTNITDEAEKYNIVGYDGYYGAFISREYVESEGTLCYSMWSKDKVLGEAKE